MKKDETFKTAERIIATLRARGHVALLAGGCVRDRLMKRVPTDYDIATSARPLNVQSAFKRTEPVGAAFGVMLVIEDQQPFEVATFRADGAYSDGRHPDTITFTNAEEDAKRRDFTVNAMFYDVDERRVIDFVGGQQDLENKILRCVGDAARRFEEDKLRVLRAVRFAAELGFEIEAETWKQVKIFSKKIHDVAWERILLEMNKLLTGRDPMRALELLKDSGLLEQLLPELLPTIGCAQPDEFHPEGDVWLHTKMVVKELQTDNAWLAWAGLLHDVGKPPTFSHEEGDRIRFNMHESVGAEMAESICKRFKMPKLASERIVTLVADHLRFNPMRDMGEAKLRRLMRRADIEDLFALHKADCVASHGDMELYDLARRRQAKLKAESSTRPLAPEPLLTGQDLIAAGLKPGPRFKEILAELEDLQLEGKLSSKAQAEAWFQEKHLQDKLIS